MGFSFTVGVSVGGRRLLFLWQRVELGRAGGGAVCKTSKSDRRGRKGAKVQDDPLGRALNKALRGTRDQEF